MEVREVIPRDAIPSIDDPAFGETYFGDADDEVIVVDLDGSRPRAYPVRILHYHEIANDRIDHRPVTVTWCPLCGSAVVYDARVGDRELAFGVSGKLAADDLVLYDRQTGTEWKQSSGEAIAGPLRGERLEPLPFAMVPWRRFAADHPDGLVLSPPGGESEAASEDDTSAEIRYDAEPYREYFEGRGYGLAAHRGSGGGDREWSRDDLDPKSVVLGIERGGEALGFPREVVEAHGGVVRTAVGGRGLVVFATPDGLHAFSDPGLEFSPTDDPSRFRADGTTWDGASGQADDGRRLERLPARRLFAWQDDHGPDAFFLG